MKTLKYRFNHPVEGKISLSYPDFSRVIKTMEFSSNENNEIEVDLDGVAPGKWHIVIDWEFGKEQFSMSREIVID